MILLALEFSSPVRNVAVLSFPDNAGRVELGAPADKPGVVVLSAVSDEGVKGVRPLSLVEAALKKAGKERGEIEAIVIGLGPGSYVGIRSALALAQGWQLARPVRAMGIGSADCIAAGAHRRGWFGRTQVAIDAQRGELYAAEYEIDPAGFRLVQPLRLKNIVEAQQSSPGAVVGPEVKRWFDAGKVLIPEAMDLGKLAMGRDDWCRADELEPIYLRTTAFVKAPPPRIVPT